MPKSFQASLTLLLAACGLSGCAQMPPAQVAPGSYFSITCTTTSAIDDGICDMQAYQRCTHPQRSSEWTSPEQDHTFVHSVTYYCQ